MLVFPPVYRPMADGSRSQGTGRPAAETSGGPLTCTPFPLGTTNSAMLCPHFFGGMAAVPPTQGAQAFVPHSQKQYGAAQVWPCAPPSTFDPKMQLYNPWDNCLASTWLTFGDKHHIHESMRQSGHLSKDARQFTKTKFDGRLSVVTEDRVQTSGIHRYLVQFTEGELSSADGLGFVFSSVLPCPKNIQRITSIFVNRAGRFCMRAKRVVRRSDISVKQLELGDWIELTVDLNAQTAHCTVWPKEGPKSVSEKFAFGQMLTNFMNEEVVSGERFTSTQSECSAGYFGCLVKNVGVTVTFGS